MTDREISAKLTEIERSANPELLCQELDDQTLLDLMKVEKHRPFYLRKSAAEEYQRRQKVRNWMYRCDSPSDDVDTECRWDADPQ